MGVVKIVKISDILLGLGLGSRLGLSATINYFWFDLIWFDLIWLGLGLELGLGLRSGLGLGLGLGYLVTVSKKQYLAPSIEYADKYC